MIAPTTAGRIMPHTLPSSPPISPTWSAIASSAAPMHMSSTIFLIRCFSISLSDLSIQN